MKRIDNLEQKHSVTTFKLAHIIIQQSFKMNTKGKLKHSSFPYKLFKVKLFSP